MIKFFFYIRYYGFDIAKIIQEEVEEQPKRVQEIS